MPVQEFKPGKGGQKEDIGAAITYAKDNAGVLPTIIRFFAGLFGALFAPKAPRQ